MLISDIVIIRNFDLPWKFVYPMLASNMSHRNRYEMKMFLYCYGNKMSEYNTIQGVGWIFGHVILKSYKR